MSKNETLTIVQRVFDNNFVCKCIEVSIIDRSCIFGLSVFILSIILLILNVRAFIKMTKFYRKMNFENMVILLSIFQIADLQLVLIFSYDILFETFFLLQIFIISSIIRKFTILSKEPKTFWGKNGMFIILNILNILLYSIFPIYLYIFDESGHHLFIKVIYRAFHVITTGILTYYCCIFIRYINNYNNLNKNSNSSKADEEEQMFYSKKKKQITFLYLVNILCAFVQITVTITRNFFIRNYYTINRYKTIPNNQNADFIYYIYLIICFFNVMVTFVCFYFMIRRQYSNQEKLAAKKMKRNKGNVLDQKFIDSEKESNNHDVTDFINNDTIDSEKVPMSIADGNFDNYFSSTKLLPDDVN